MRHDVPAPSPSSALPLRARSLLAIWTATLLVLVLVKFRDLPPVLSGLLLPHLALVAWHLHARSGRREANPQPTPADSAGAPCAHSDPEIVGCPPSSLSGERLESFDPRGAHPALMDPPESPPPNPRKVRVRRRGKPTPPPETAPATWVQVAPGRFVRGEDPDPAPDAPPDASGEDATAAVPAGEPPAHEAVPEESHESGARDTPYGPPGGESGSEEGDEAATVGDAGDGRSEPQVVPHREGAPGKAPEFRPFPAAEVTSGTGGAAPAPQGRTTA